MKQVSERTPNGGKTETKQPENGKIIKIMPSAAAAAERQTGTLDLGWKEQTEQ